MQDPHHPFKGKLFTAKDPGFSVAAKGGLWNLLQPDRGPELIAQAVDIEDVQSIVNYAREKHLKIAVRGGGHNWSCPSLRRGGIMLDLSAMTKVISVDKGSRRAVIEPVISNRDMIRHLAPYDLAYPTGHCPTVKASGYLLGGGMAWNHGVWGPGCGSVEAIDMVTADGKLVTASPTENADLFWAARGAGAGFFAVAVRYHLKLYPLPKYIASSLYYFTASDAVEVANWLGPLADTMSPSVELSLFMVNAPASLKDQTKNDKGRACMVTAAVFADSEEEAHRHLLPLEECPLMSHCLQRIFAQKTDFEGLFDASESLWPRPMRSLVDALFYDEKLSVICQDTVDHFINVPNDLTVYMFAVFTGGSAPATPKDAAFGMTGKLYGGAWTMWDDPGQDEAMIHWHAVMMQKLAPHVKGHYISETDTSRHPEYIERSYVPGTLARIEQLRRTYDPTGVFYKLDEDLK